MSVFWIAVTVQCIDCVAQQKNEADPKLSIPDFQDTIGRQFPRTFEMDATGTLTLVSQSRGFKITATDFLVDEKVQQYLELSKKQNQEIRELTELMNEDIRNAHRDIRAKLAEGEGAKAAKFAELVFESKEIYRRKYEKAYFAVLHEHQREYYTQFLNWVRIRDSGLANELIKGPIGKELAITRQQKALLSEEAILLQKRMRIEVTEIENKMLRRLRAATPATIQNYLDEIGFFKIEMTGDIDYFLSSESAEDIVDGNIRIHRYSMDERFPVVMFESDLTCGIQYGRRTDYRGNYGRLNTGFTPPFIGNPIAKLLTSEKFAKFFELNRRQKNEINSLKKKLSDQFSTVYMKIVNASESKDRALKQIQSACKTIVFEMINILDSNQQKKLNALLNRHRVRHCGYILTIENVAKLLDVAISEREMRQLKEVQEKIETDILSDIKRLEGTIEKRLLDRLAPTQRRQYKYLTGERPSLMTPNLNRHLLDLSSVVSLNQ